jgi:hypothetical protein
MEEMNSAFTRLQN